MTHLQLFTRGLRAIFKFDRQTRTARTGSTILLIFESGYTFLRYNQELLIAAQFTDVWFMQSLLNQRSMY